jgi:hypothetical protein
MEFQPYAEGDGAVMVHGPQGGWHVEASMRVTNTVPIVAIRYTIEAEGARISDNNYRVQILQDGPCTGYYPGMYGYLNVTALAVGDRVAYASAPIGAYAEARLMPADRLVKIPDSISDEQAAAMMLQGMTTQYLVRRTYKIQPGDTIRVPERRF